MEIQIHMIDGKNLIIKATTQIDAYVASNKFTSQIHYLEEGYLTRVFTGTLGSPEISTSHKYVGLAGLLAEVDYFKIDESGELFKTSAILSFS